MQTGFHRCLAELNAAEDAWFEGKGQDGYIRWAHDYTSMMRLVLKGICEDIDAQQNESRPAVETSNTES